MARFVKAGRLARVAVAVAALSAAAGPSALSQTAGGMWEVSGAPGSRQPIRQCIRDTRILAQFEHRGRACPQTVLSDSHVQSRIEYACGASGFGTSSITVITPRSLRIQTQGISGGLPFDYVIQARRIGSCRAH